MTSVEIAGGMMEQPRTELQRHSSIFGDTAVQFPKDDLNLIEAIFDEASVRPRNIVLAR